MTDHYLIPQILTWGRNQGKPNTVDVNGRFCQEQVETLRRWLRDQYKKRNQAVFGDWRKGYELTIGKEYIGITNGYGRFKIYYRCPEPAQFTHDEIPFDGRPMQSPEPTSERQDYGLPVEW